MRLSSSTYYSDPKISRSERESFEADVRGKIEQIRPKKKFVKTTDSNHSHRGYPNLIEEMTLAGISQVFASDITYIRIENGSCTWR